MIMPSYLGIFSEIDRPLDFNETLVICSVLNVVSLNNIRFLLKSLFKKLSALKVIYFVCNSDENKLSFIISIACLKIFLRKKKKKKKNR